MPSENSLESPRFFRVEPPLASFDQDELVWFDIINSVAFKPINDDSCDEYSEDDILKYCSNAFKQTATIKIQKILMDQLEKDPNLIAKINVTPQNISSLIEYNPMFAYKILLFLMKSEKSTEYLTAMVNIEMSLNSLEVINRLTSNIEFPVEFLHLYISNCINTIEKISDNKFYQKRAVRILCVFLQCLIRRKIEFGELMIEIESFCITFSKIKEAAELYKLCKSA